MFEAEFNMPAYIFKSYKYDIIWKIKNIIIRFNIFYFILHYPSCKSRMY